jgi:glycosyltransferase involved in cell wall biosynthesis
MIEVLENGELRARLTQNALAYSEVHSWSQRKADYLKIVDGLVGQDVHASSAS